MIRQASLVFLLVSFFGVAYGAELATKDMIYNLNERVADNLRGDPQSEERMAAIKEIAVNYSLQTSFVTALKEHTRKIEESSNELDEIFNFSALMDICAEQINQDFKALGFYTVPAIVFESRQNLKLNPSNELLTVNEKEYLIVKHLTLTTSPPSWRDYLTRVKHPSPPPPPRNLLPRTSEERDAWRKGVDLGWQLGLEQASIEFKNRSRRLASDFKGMLSYIRLVDSGVISPPFISIENAPTRLTKGGSKLKINEYVYKITKQSSFTVPSNWGAKLGDDRGSLRTHKALNDAQKGKSSLK